MFAGSSRELSVALGSAAKALLVGAKTVKGPLAESAPVRLPSLSAVTRVDRSAMPAARLTMSCAGAMFSVGVGAARAMQTRLVRVRVMAV